MCDTDSVGKFNFSKIIIGFAIHVLVHIVLTSSSSSSSSSSMNASSSCTSIFVKFNANSRNDWSLALLTFRPRQFPIFVVGNCRGRKVNSAKFQSFLPLALNFTKMEVQELRHSYYYYYYYSTCKYYMHKHMASQTHPGSSGKIRKSFAKSCESKERRKSCKDLKHLTSFTEYKFDEISSKTRQMSSKIRTCASAMMRSS